MVRLIALAASLIVIASASAEACDKPKETPITLERKLHGQWESGPCVGELTLRPDGTFERSHYSPGGNKLTGTWAVRWNALPPTLSMTCEASDEPNFVGKTSEFKLTQLDDDTLAYERPETPGKPVRYERAIRGAKP